jgi:6-phosphogluconate dehydrogenase (decarboxylating)
VWRLHKELSEQRVEFLDAPISGVPRGAASGKLAIWVGGSRFAYESHKPVFDQVADQVRYIGNTGAGTMTKLAHNMVSTSMKFVLAEVLTWASKQSWIFYPYGRRCGVVWPEECTGLEVFKGFLSGNTETPTFALRLM